MSAWASEGLPFHRWLIWRSAWLLVRLTLAPLMRIKVQGRENIPPEGGALMLANHTTFLDFLICFWGVYRPAHGIGSEQVFRNPVAGFLLRQVNAIPFAKGASDGAAVRALVEAYEKGAIIGMFPEGKRSWTGAPLPIKVGTGRLVKSLGCPVIYCRVTTGFLHLPRWARWPRLVPWHMSYSAPEHFAEDATVEEINAAIARGIAIDPETVELPPRSWGFRLAEGLPDYLWACPDCFQLETLQVADDKDCVRCTACARQWRLDLRSQMNAESADSISCGVGEARRRLSAHFPVDQDMQCDSMEILTVHRGRRKPTPLAHGHGRLTADAVEVERDGAIVWRLAYADMTAVLLQVGNALHVRAGGQNYQIDPGGHSRLRWHHFLLRRVRAAGFAVRT